MTSTTQCSNGFSDAEAGVVTSKDALRVPSPSPFEDLVGDDHRIDAALNQYYGPIVYLDDAPLTPRRARQVARFLLAAADAAEDIEGGAR